MKDLLEQMKDEDGKMKDKYEGKQRVYLYMKIFYGFFISWMGYNVLMSEQLYQKNEKYLKETMNYIKNVTNFYYPNLLSNKKVIQFVDYDKLLNKTNEITNGFCYIFIIGGFITSIGLKIGKRIVFFALLLNILLVHNILYFKGEKLKVNVLKYMTLLGGANFL